MYDVFSCSCCAKSSEVQSDYGELELNIQGMKSITDSLLDFFKVSLFVRGVSISVPL